jgi:6-phosphogluconolactonase
MGSASLPAFLTVVLLLLCPLCAKSLKDPFFAGFYNEMGHASIASYTISESGTPLLFAYSNAGINVSWIARHPSLRVAYALQESSSGVVASYSINISNGKLRLIGPAQNSGGQYPVHLCVHPSGSFLFVANYGGNVAVLSLLPDGTLTPPVQTIQTGTFAHCVIVSPIDPSHVFVVSFGDDAVLQFLLDPVAGTLSPNPIAPIVALPRHTGPRHLLIHPHYPMAFITDEGNGTAVALISVCNYDSARGTLSLLRSLSALPEGADAKGMRPSELMLSKDGRFLYVSIRDDAGKSDSIAVFSVQTDAFKVRLLANYQVCFCPRSMTLMEGDAADILVVGCEIARAIKTFRVNRANGMLNEIGFSSVVDPVAFVGAAALAPLPAP